MPRTPDGLGIRCIATTQLHEPCRAWAIIDSEYCVHHEPRLAEARKGWRRRGGLLSSDARRMKHRVRNLVDDAALERAFLVMFYKFHGPGHPVTGSDHNSMLSTVR